MAATVTAAASAGKLRAEGPESGVERPFAWASVPAPTLDTPTLDTPTLDSRPYP